jgi:hypothetical protein
MKPSQVKDSQFDDKCPECNVHPGYINWRELPMNEEIRKNLTIQPPKRFYPSFTAAAEAWGTHITEGLTND